MASTQRFWFYEQFHVQHVRHSQGILAQHVDVPLHTHELLQLPNRLSNSVHVLSKSEHDVWKRVCRQNGNAKYASWKHVYVFASQYLERKQVLSRQRCDPARTHFQPDLPEPISPTYAFSDPC